MPVSIDHVKITVTNFNRSKLFYSKLFNFFKLKKIFETDERSAWRSRIVMFGTKDWTFEIQEGKKKVKFDRHRTGLDHIAFSSPSKKVLTICIYFSKRINSKHLGPENILNIVKGIMHAFFSTRMK